MNLFPPGLFEFSKGSVPFATEAEDTYFPSQPNWLTQKDAFRHLVWMGENQRKLGTPVANLTGMFHEFLGMKDHPLEQLMDEHNNRIALKHMKGAKTQAEILERAQRLLSKAATINSMEEYEKIKDQDIPFFVGDFGIQNPDVFGDTTK